MILAKTLRDIAKESRLNKAEKVSLRLIALDVAKLEKMNEMLPEIRKRLKEHIICTCVKCTERREQKRRSRPNPIE